MQLNIDDVLYRDQYGAFNNHLDDEVLRASREGGGPGSPTINILGETGFDANTYVMPVVLIPAAIWLFGSGLIGLIGIVRRQPIS